MSGLRWVICCAALAILVAVLNGCATAAARSGSVQQAESREALMGPEGLTVAQLQSEVMSFADTYASFVGQASEDLMLIAETPEQRLVAHETKLSSVSGAFTVASNPNPAVGLLDMLVLVRLEHDAIARFGPEVFGENAEIVIRAYAKSDRLITNLAEKTLWPAELEELDALIEAWQAQHPDQWQVSYIRFDDFAGHRQLTQTSAKKGGSLFTIVGLDPLAKMDPTLRQIEQSRLLGERIFFYVSRLPFVLGWQAEAFYYRLAASPEFMTLIDVSNRMTAVAENLPVEIRENLAIEREAAVNQVSEETHSVFHSTADRLIAGFESQRKGLVEDVDASREVVTDLRETLVVGNELVNSLESFVAHFEDPDPDPDKKPVDVRGTVQDTGVLVKDLNQLVVTLDEILAPERVSELQAALGSAEASGRRLINHTFLLLGLIVVLIFALSLIKIFTQKRLGVPAQSSLERGAAVIETKKIDPGSVSPPAQRVRTST